MDMKREFLKEDGSLDVECINKLPLEEYMHTIGGLTQEQVKEYISGVLLIRESQEPMRPVYVDYGFDDERSGVDAEAFINGLRNNIENKRGVN